MWNSPNLDLSYSVYGKWTQIAGLVFSLKLFSCLGAFLQIFNLMLFVHTSHADFDFHQCSRFTGCCF